jgi:hypothetical protein
MPGRFANEVSQKLAAFALVERRFAPILNGRYSRSFTPPSVTFRMTSYARS